MPDRPKPAPRSAPDSRKGPPENEPAPDGATGSEPNKQTDLATLAARFAAHSGGKFTPEFSAELALDIVLNEIAEQACLATGATGAAIFLARDGKMVCRASSGTTAPELGARLEEGSGISQACVASHQIQRCDDAQADPRTDAESSRSLGIRSVIVLPLLRNRKMAGLFEAFSIRPAAFRERDQRTLETLARRVVENLERAERPFPIPSFASNALPSLAQAGDGARHPAADFGDEEKRLTQAFGGQASSSPTGGHGLEVLTWALGVVVMGCAVLMGVLVIQRLGWLPVGHHSSTATGVNSASAEPRAPTEKNSVGEAAGSATQPSAPIADLNQGELNDGKRGAEASHSASGRPGAADPVQAGTLRVYKNGREVFRVLPATNSSESDAPTVQRASSIEPANTSELSSAAVEDDLAKRVEPEYPEEARRQKIQGAVVLEVHIDQSGVVQEVKLISGPDLLARAAIDAVKQWRFKPRGTDTPAETQTQITLNFKLPQ